MRKLVSFVVALAAVWWGCSGAPPLPFSNIQVDIPAFSSDRPTSSTVMRVGNNIEETILLPQAKLEHVEKAVARLKKQGWRPLRTDATINSWTFLLEKEGLQIEFSYQAGRGATVTARRRADVKQETSSQ